MTLILCLEDSAGNDINLEVKPSDDFSAFLQRAKARLGYVPKLTDITEGKQVSLKDNIYKFLINAELNKDAEENRDVQSDEVDEDDEYGEVEYLTENEEVSQEPITEDASVDNGDEDLPGSDMEEYSQMEFLDDDSEESEVRDIEVLDSSLEEDFDELGSDNDLENHNRKLTEFEVELGDFKNALSDLLCGDVPEVVENEKKQLYTKEDLLDMLISSPERPDDDGEKEKDVIVRETRRKRRLSEKFNPRNKEKDQPYKKLKTNNLSGKILSSFDIAMLKRTVRQPTVSLMMISDETIEMCVSSPEELRKFMLKHDKTKSGVSMKKVFLDDSKYLPSNYEDIDNEGIYDYGLDDELNIQIDMNDLLMVRKDKKPTKRDNEEVVKAIGGLNKMMRIDKKFTSPFPGKRPRGRPRKHDKVVLAAPVKKESIELDSHTTYLDAVVKTEPIDDDDDYIPGQNIDWLKNKKKKKFICRMCGHAFPKLDLPQTFAHALTHRVPGKPVFPCIFCAYGYTTYTELQKHIKEEHKKGSPKKIKLNTPLTTISGRPRGRPGRKPKNSLYNGLKMEMIDHEEVCDIEVLEEWLEDDEEELLLQNVNNNNVPSQKQEILQEETYIEETLEELIEDDDMKQINKSEENDFDPSGDEEWLLEENEEQIYSDDSDTKKESRGIFKKRPRASKLWKHKCTVCSHSFSTEDLLVNHKCSGPKSKVRSSKGIHRCALCGQSFMTRRRLDYHQSFHQVELLEMKQVCSKCPDKIFNTEAELFDHINNEHNIDFVCQHQGCNKKFHLRSALRAHSRIHGNKCHQCNVCGKQFYDVHNLREHNITHLSIKPFQCHICHKFLNRRSRLRMHLLSHESCPVENNVLGCKHCKMAFKDVTDAEKHVLESVECSSNIMSNIDGTELLDVLEKFDVKDDIAEMHPLSENVEQSKESSVDDIVNETLAKTGIVDVPLNVLSNLEIVNGDMMTLSDEVVGVKMLTEEDVKDMVDEQFQRDAAALSNKDTTDNIIDNAISSKSNCKLMQDIGTVKDLLDQVGVDMQTLNESELSKNMNPDEGACVNYFIDSSMTIIEEHDQDPDVTIAGEFTQQDSTQNVTNKKLVSEAELLGQLKDQTKAFISVIKTKMVLRCEYCEKTYHTKEALNIHRKCHDGLRNPFICNICNVAFSTYARCTSHKTTHGFYKFNIDGDKEKGSQDIGGFESFPVVKYFLCQHCNKTFLHWTYLQVHKRHKHGHTTYYFNCKICSEKFTDSWALNSHRRKAHADTINVKKNTNTSYRCADCGEGFNKRIMLAKHRQDQHGDSSMIQMRNRPGPFACTSCDKMYQTKVGLDGHMRSHNGGVYLCDLCGNGFAHRAGLETHHRRVHLREIKYTCRECGQNFFTPGDLGSHKRCHTGEKPFPCDYCSMSFRTKGRRNEHHRTHTGERPYPCDICGLAFRRSNAMKNHRVTHTGERRFVCSYCPKLFHVQSNLKSHIKLKHPDQYVVLEVKGGGTDVRAALEASIKMITDNEQESKDGQSEIISTGDGSQMLVLEDVIIEDESGGALRQESGVNIMEYAYSTDDINTSVGHGINEDFNQDEDNKGEAKIQIQLVDEVDNGHSLLYTVEDGSVVDNEIRLIGGGVRYELVDDVGEDQKHPQFTIIDGDQFIKDDDGQNQVYYS